MKHELAVYEDSVGSKADYSKDYYRGQALNLSIKGLEHVIAYQVGVQWWRDLCENELAERILLG